MSITVGNTTTGAIAIIGLGAVIGLTVQPLDIANVRTGTIWGLGVAAVYVLIVALIAMRRPKGKPNTT